MTGFQDIFGQDRAIEQILGAWRADRLPHGLIFAGSTGVGKRLTAITLGGLFLCEKPQGGQPCGKCDSCRVYPSGNHPDYHYIYRQLIRLEKSDVKARDLSIDVIRPYLLEPASHKPAMNRGKVFVIEDADLMSTGAQNSMLKTLEEPFGRALIILLTNAPDALLPTIRSRCQLVRFMSLPVEKVKSELARRNYAAQDALEAAVLSEGSLGRAISFIDQGVVAATRELRKRLEALTAGQGSGDMPDWLCDAAKAYAAKQLEIDDKASEDQLTREGLALYLKLMSQYFRRRLAAGAETAMEAFCGGIDAIVQAEGFIDANVNLTLILQALAVRLEQVFRFV